MARSARLKLALLATGVVLAHLAGLEWISRQANAVSGLPAFVPPLYTRLLQPAAPPPVVHVASAARPPPVPRRPHAATKPTPPASSPQEIRRQQEEEAEAAQRAVEEAVERDAEERAREEREREERLARAAAEAASQPAPAASAPADAASALSSADAALDAWPTDTRLTYDLRGQFRGGPLFGDARVQWQRDGGKYQVRLDIRIQIFGTQVLTSQGEVTPDGLLPRAYEELGPRKRRVAHLGDTVVTLDNGSTVPRPPGVQDTASQFVELTQRFASGQEKLEVGRAITVWLARPGGVDRWTYDITEEEVLRTPTLGDVPAFHLKPRPVAAARGNITAEMWFAPTLQYLPVRIKVNMGSEAFLDLVVDHIEQR